MESRRYSDHHEHREYLLTEKGRDLLPMIVALTHWGDRWAAPHGPPVVFEHADCGGNVHQHLRCATCGEVLTPGSTRTRPGKPMPPPG